MYSYYANRRYDVRDSTARRRGEPNSKTDVTGWHKLPGFIAILIIIGCIFYILSLDISPRIVTVEQPDESLSILQSEEIYQEAARDALKANVLHRFKLTIDTRSIERSLLQQFPELDQIAITVPVASRRPVIEIRAKTPAFVLTSDVNAVVVDTRGRVIVDVADVEHDVQSMVPQIIDEVGLTPKVGDWILPSDTVAFIKSTKLLLESANIKVEQLVLPVIANELHVWPQGEGYYLKFNTANDAREQVGAYIATKKDLNAKGVQPGEYIDVRVEGRVFYK
ncbi:MAG: hypothetical protein U5K77_00425 [Candidatus Saccharibacteria bacterium]|nr:hypothetical protein [Candidatus Saccharibacteria bacterium]